MEGRMVAEANRTQEELTEIGVKICELGRVRG